MTQRIDAILAGDEARREGEAEARVDRGEALADEVERLVRNPQALAEALDRAPFSLYGAVIEALWPVGGPEPVTVKALAARLRARGLPTLPGLYAGSLSSYLLDVAQARLERREEEA